MNILHVKLDVLKFGLQIGFHMLRHTKKLLKLLT